LPQNLRRFVHKNAAITKTITDMYIHERENWTQFRWDESKISLLLEIASRKQGLLYGRLGDVGFDSKLRAMAENLTMDVVHSSEIEGIKLNIDEVRSSIARKLGIENVKYTAPSHYVDSVVSVMLEAIKNYNKPLTKQRLCAWQAAFFPSGYSEGSEIEVGRYRTNEEHIVSGMFGRERIHYIAPSPDRVDAEMAKFIDWFNADLTISSVVSSAIAHLWFVSIHPFEDGNGRMARILSDMMLARGDGSEFRFYNVSAQINRNKNKYYDVLEATQHGDGDITDWLVWYINTLIASLDDAYAGVCTVLNKSLFWKAHSEITFSERQTAILNLFLDGYEAKITSKNWATLAKCSTDTANRDIQDLLAKNVLKIDIPGAKRPSYSIVYNLEDISVFFSDIEVREEDGKFYLIGRFKGITEVHERLLPLDAKRLQKGDIPMAAILNKYCSYLLLK
jgi:Fic family protein